MENRENFPSQHQVFFPESYCPDKLPGGREEFALEFPSSFRGFYPEFPHLDQLSVNGSSSNLLYGGQSSCFDPFDASAAFGCLPNFDFYETKPFSNGATFPPLIENNFPVAGGGISDYSPIMNAPITIVPPLRSHLVMPFNCRNIDPLKYRLPDDCSSTTTENGCRPEVGRPSAVIVPRRASKVRKKKSNVVKGQWTVEEDRVLVQLVERYGVRKWSQIAQILNGRIGKQCRERWHNHLRPDIKKDMWSEEEDKILIDAHAEIGNKWAEIAKKLPGRTENSIKNHWNATKRRQFSRRKCRSKYPRQSSLLQEYIKSLNIETINAGCRKKSSLTVANAAMPESSNATMNKAQTHGGDQRRHPPPAPSEAYSGDGDVPEYDFIDMPEFNFDTLEFEESSIDSLLEGMNHDLHGGHHEMEIPPLELGSLMHCEVKKELDLVEMISQVNL
ncbi:hypothetical protein Nepgr_023334 [Nepenthes gracilis]|uniref:Transcription factor MYB98 n=1 Tax=Nepenthes gracilis TaxID=150966 RepID=A0AAD3XXM0_NEPGR|nr:hypothetical protein Nepgr_023334 [Nepenthes gracilis]